MAAQQKIVLSASRDIPFNKLVLSQSNVRRVKAGVSIEQLAESIAQRTLLQSLSVRPVRDAEGNETGMFEVPAGGRRYRALEFLVKQKRMAKTQAVPCVVRLDGVAEDDSLAENNHREDLHPLDQFRSFQSLVEKGFGEEEIAARHFVSVAIVRQRLKLAAVSARLLEFYEKNEITLEQLMAFTVTVDQARQEQVWESLEKSHNKEPYYIRRLLTETAIRATDRRAQFAGVDVYEAAGGVVMRDLFEEDRGGWLRDPALLDRLVAEKLKSKAQAIAAEGWKWVEAAVDFSYGHTNGLRRLVGEAIEMTDEERASYEALKAEFEQLEHEYAEADELPDEVDARLCELETLIESFEQRPVRFEPEDIARAGVFVSVDAEGELDIERGFVRPEDEASASGSDGEAEGCDSDAVREDHPTSAVRASEIRVAGDVDSSSAERLDEVEVVRPLSDRLVMELTAHRTLALRDAVARNLDVAFLSVLHALCLCAFYRYSSATCLEITAKSSGFTAQAPGLKDSASSKSIAARHEQWQRQLPDKPDDLWATLHSFDADSRSDLFAHCASLSVNAVREPWARDEAPLRHVDELARAVQLDMTAAGWSATSDNYLGRVSKARILEAVREAKGEASAQLIDHLKKADMAREAERLLAGTGWLPEPLRAPNDDEAQVEISENSRGEAVDLPEFLEGDEEADAASDDDCAEMPPERPVAAE